MTVQDDGPCGRRPTRQECRVLGRRRVEVSVAPLVAGIQVEGDEVGLALMQRVGTERDEMHEDERREDPARQVPSRVADRAVHP